MQHNQFERLETLVGKDSVDLLKNKKVLVVGLGGVGGYVVESLARSGIGMLALVDYDEVDITNLNRQIIALNSTIGKKKTELFKDRINDINRECKVLVYDVFLNETNYNTIINDDYDFVIDCCDSVEAKKILLREAVNKNMNFIASMGTANRMNPTMLEIVELHKTVNDPLARIMRKYVRDNKITKKVMVLSSKEIPMKNGKKLGSNSFVPASAGLLIGSYVIKKLIDNNLQKK